MKVECPNCKKVLQAPDEWAGRKVKCPGCKKPIALPKGGAAEPELNLDLNSLEAIEDAGEALVFERKGKPLTLKQAQQAVATDKPPPKADPHVRTCSKCGQTLRSEDIYSDLMCRNCGATVPGAEIESKENLKAKYTSAMAGRMTTKVSFYTGFTSAAIYPLPAIANILLGMGIALATIALPLGGVLAFTESSSLNPINERGADGGGSAAWVGVFLTVMFIAQGIYFGAVGYYILIDTIRAVTAGNEQPPNLTWNVINLGAALGGYAALLAFYAIVLIALMGGIPTGMDDLASISAPWKLMVIALLTFGVPMNMIGLASSHAFDGLHPVKVFRSIARLLGHYTFLFLIVLLYLGFYVGLMWAVMSWAGPAIADAATHGIKNGLVKLLIGVCAWAVVMGLGFYFAYSIGRILGLFSRTYREEIEFEM